MQKIGKVDTEALMILCHDVMKGYGEPMSYRLLYEAITSSGAFDMSSYSRPTDSLYSLLIADIRKNTGRFKFMGKGIFIAYCLADFPEADELTVQPKVVVRPLPIAHEPGSRRCGDCASASYSGVQIVLQTTADCGCAASGRWFVSPYALSCGEFREKSYSTHEREHVDKLEGVELIKRINIEVSRVRRIQR